MSYSRYENWRLSICICMMLSGRSSESKVVQRCMEHSVCIWMELSGRNLESKNVQECKIKHGGEHGAKGVREGRHLVVSENFTFFVIFLSCHKNVMCIPNMSERSVEKVAIVSEGVQRVPEIVQRKIGPRKVHL